MSSESVRSAPVARISRDALRANILAILDADPGAVIDVRRDACGHGSDLVAGVARELGAPILVAGAEGERAASLEALYGLAGQGTPVMTLHAPVLSTKPLRAGEGVSYGYRFRAQRDTTIALVAGGYAQGLVRAIGGRAETILNGRRRRIVGRVAMDVHVVDLEGDDALPGDEAVVFGADDPALLAAWADATGMTELELAAIVGLHVEQEETA